MKNLTLAIILPFAAALSTAASAATSWNFNGPESGYQGLNGTNLTLSSGVLEARVNDSETGVLFSFNAIQLSNVGDYIEATYSIQLSGATWGATGFRYILTALSEGASELGYGGWLQTNPLIDKRNRIHAFDDFSGMHPNGTVRKYLSNSSLGADVSAARDISLKMELTDINELKITFTGEKEDGSLYTDFYVQSNPATTTFDSLYIMGAGGHNMDFDLHSVAILTNIPEPSAALLGSLGALLVLRRKRH